METGPHKKKGRLCAALSFKDGFRIDESALIGYQPLRPDIDDAMEIGENLVMLAGAILYKGTKLGKNAIIGHHAIIREENIIGDSFRLWNNSVVDYGCTIGHNVKIHCNCYVAQYTVIEDDVFLAPGVIIGNDLHPGCSLSIICMKKTKVIIKRGAQIGVNVTILPGVTIGEKVLVGGGSVVTSDVQTGTVVAGNPAKIINKINKLKCVTGLTNTPYHKGGK